MQPGGVHKVHSTSQFTRIPDDITHLIARSASFEVLASLIRCNKSLHRSCTALLFREIRLHKPIQLVKLCRNKEALSRLSETQSIFLEEGLFYYDFWTGLVEQSVEASEYLILVLRAAASLLRLQIVDSPTIDYIWPEIIEDLCAMSSDSTFLPKLEILVGNRSVLSMIESLKEGRPIKFLYFHDDRDVIVVETYPSFFKWFGVSSTTNSSFLEQTRVHDFSPTEIGSLVYESKGCLRTYLQFHFTIRFPEAAKTQGDAHIPDLLAWLREMIRAAKLSSDDIHWLNISFDPSPSSIPSSTKYSIVAELTELLPQLEGIQVSSPLFAWHKHETSHDTSQDPLPAWTPEPGPWCMDWWMNTLHLDFEGTKTREEAEHIAEKLREGMYRRYDFRKVLDMYFLVHYVLSRNA